MATDFIRKDIVPIPFIAYRHRHRLTFLPVAVALCTLSVALCLLSLYFHAAQTLSNSTDTSLPPKLSSTPTGVFDRLAPIRPFLFP